MITSPVGFQNFSIVWSRCFIMLPTSSNPPRVHIFTKPSSSQLADPGSACGRPGRSHLCSLGPAQLFDKPKCGSNNLNSFSSLLVVLLTIFLGYDSWRSSVSWSLQEKLSFCTQTPDSRGFAATGKVQQKSTQRFSDQQIDELVQDLIIQNSSHI